MEYRIKTSREYPESILNKDYAFSAFNNGKVFDKKVTGKLPAMGWNSWNAFGSQNTEELTKAMAEKMVELGLDKLGYKYLVLDDGCYKNERVDGKLSNDEVKFPSGFRALADYIHSKGLKFGMYNDIGTNLCAGAAVGTCGFEDVDAKSYAEWDIDFLKADNCYYLWDNATFSDPTNAKYVFTPRIKSICLSKSDYSKTYNAIKDGILWGNGGLKEEAGYVDYIGTLDGTGPENSPLFDVSSELVFGVEILEDGEYSLSVEYASDCENGCGCWLQIAVGNAENALCIFDDMLEATKDKDTFVTRKIISTNLKSGKNIIRLMNHRRQENVLNSYAAMFYALKEASPDKDIILSMCEWGKNQPQSFGYKIGDSWRILNDITFAVGADGDYGKANWKSGYTDSITSQYNKAVVMDEFAGLDKGWNDPDMLVIGMNNIDYTMNRTHMAMYCMMNSPLMLGLDLRRVQKGDELYKIIANQYLLSINQDSLGIQAKRVFTTALADTDGNCNEADKVYITNNDRVDILLKPLSKGRVAVSFINVSDDDKDIGLSINCDTIVSLLKKKKLDYSSYAGNPELQVVDVWTGEETLIDDGNIRIDSILAHDNKTYIVSVK